MPTETPPALKKPKPKQKTFKARTKHNKLQQKTKQNKKTSPVTGSEAASFCPASKNGFGDSYELEY